jgi:hypothetical protein
MQKYKLQNSILKGFLVLMGLLGVGAVASAYSGSAQNVTEHGDINVTNVYSNSQAAPAQQQVGEPVENVGAASVASNASHLSLSPLPSAVGGDSGVYLKGGLEADGASYIDNTLTVSGSSTFGYTANQLNTAKVSFNSNSTTLCSVLNDSGVDRVISGMSLNITGSTGSGGLTQFRGYVSAGRADMNTAASSTLLKQSFIAVSATGKQVFGGPVPGSYYTSSTLAITALDGFTSSTPVIWPANWYATVSSTAITSSTGACVFSNYLF